MSGIVINNSQKQPTLLKKARFLSVVFMSDCFIEQWYTYNYKASESISVSQEIWSTEHDSVTLLVFSLSSARHKCRVVDPRSYSSVWVRRCIRAVLYFLFLFLPSFNMTNQDVHLNMVYPDMHNKWPENVRWLDVIISTGTGDFQRDSPAKMLCIFASVTVVILFYDYFVFCNCSLSCMWVM